MWFFLRGSKGQTLEIFKLARRTLRLCVKDLQEICTRSFRGDPKKPTSKSEVFPHSSTPLQTISLVKVSLKFEFSSWNFTQRFFGLFSKICSAIFWNSICFRFYGLFPVYISLIFKKSQIKSIFKFDSSKWSVRPKHYFKKEKSWYLKMKLLARIFQKIWSWGQKRST